MPIPALQLPAELSRQIEREGRQQYPNECCGILIGVDYAGRRTVHRLEPAANVFDQPAERRRRFSIDPRMMMEVDRRVAGEGKMILGFYHSHPDHPARPSEYDRQHAWPFYSYVIVSVTAGDVLDMTSWVLDDETSLFCRQEIAEIGI